MSSAHLALLRSVDRLYEGVVMRPDAWGDSAIEDWAVDATATEEPLSKATARSVRRCLRIAVKLRKFWLDPPAGVPSDAGDWRTRVDLALGVVAWRPTLEIADEGLADSPSHELYEAMSNRFRVVHGESFMDGMGYDAWLETRRA